MSEMRRVFNIAEEVETRVWTKYMSNAYDLLSNLEYTVQDAGLYQGQVWWSSKFYKIISSYLYNICSFKLVIVEELLSTNLLRCELL